MIFYHTHPTHNSYTKKYYTRIKDILIDFFFFLFLCVGLLSPCEFFGL